MNRRLRRPTVIDLFAGAGGMSLGAARAGFDVCAAVELDPIAVATHALNFPNSKHLEWDVSKTSGADLLRATGLATRALDGLVGGPPCQGFSNIGKRSGDDSRNSLFGHFFRLVAETRPRFFLAENVPGILAERNLTIVRSALAKVPNHYCVFAASEVAAHELGAPTTRTRVFFFGFDPDRVDVIDESKLFHRSGFPTTLVGEALRGLPRVRADWQGEEEGWRRVEQDADGGPFRRRLYDSVPPGVGSPKALRRLRDLDEVSGNLGTLHTADVIDRFRRLRPGATDPVSRATRLDVDGFCPTLRAGTNVDRGSFQAVRPIHHSSPRVITPREAARLQGFPDWFQFHRTKWHAFRQIGNSVSPIVGEVLLRRIRVRL